MYKALLWPKDLVTNLLQLAISAEISNFCESKLTYLSIFFFLISSSDWLGSNLEPSFLSSLLTLVSCVVSNSDFFNLPKSNTIAKWAYGKS